MGPFSRLHLLCLLGILVGKKYRKKYFAMAGSEISEYFVIFIDPSTFDYMVDCNHEEATLHFVFVYVQYV